MVYRPGDAAANLTASEQLDAISAKRTAAQAERAKAEAAEAAEAKAAAAEIAEQLGVKWDPDATGKKSDRQVAKLAEARFDVAAAKVAGERAQQQTIARLATGSWVDGQPSAGRVVREAQIARMDADRAKAVGMTWNPEPATAAERFAQRNALRERERSLGITQEPPERDTGLEM